MLQARFAFLRCTAALLVVAACNPSPDVRSGAPESSRAVASGGRIAAPVPESHHANNYIPKDLDECFIELKKILSEAELNSFREESEDDISAYHHGLGRAIRNNWGLWAGGRLATWFNDRGISHPDDMSGIILDSFWRHLNNQPIRLDEQIEIYRDYWKNVELKNRKQ